MHIIEHGVPPVHRSTYTADNIKPQVNNLSGYKGVSRESNGRYTAILYSNGSKIYLGTFDTPEQASDVYRKKRIELFSENA